MTGFGDSRYFVVRLKVSRPGRNAWVHEQSVWSTDKYTAAAIAARDIDPLAQIERVEVREDS